jgi:uncharacterized glyoxalase superfamily protein PhnB
MLFFGRAPKLHAAMPMRVRSLLISDNIPNMPAASFDPRANYGQMTSLTCRGRLLSSAGYLEACFCSSKLQTSYDPANQVPCENPITRVRCNLCHAYLALPGQFLVVFDAVDKRPQSYDLVILSRRFSRLR